MPKLIKKEEILQFLQENKLSFELKFKINKIGLFGSYARDEQSEDSDIDLIVEFDPNTDDLYEKKKKVRELVRSKFQKKVDLCREKYIKPYCKQQILQSAIYV